MQYGGLDRLRWKNGQPAGQHGYLTSISLGFRFLSDPTCRKCETIFCRC
uniref:Uncharacterized protein n=1 Tax=Triticum urartu TaxID=4572 RepID=A0A8R7V219_TRIUA